MPVLGFQECSQFFRNKVVCSITKGSVEKIHTCKGGICRKKFRLPIFVSYSQRGHGKRNKLAIFGLGHAASTNHNMEKRRKWPSEEPANIILGRERAGDRVQFSLPLSVHRASKYAPSLPSICRHIEGPQSRDWIQLMTTDPCTTNRTTDLRLLYGWYANFLILHLSDFYLRRKPAGQ